MFYNFLIGCGFVIAGIVIVCIILLAGTAFAMIIDKLLDKIGMEKERGIYQVKDVRDTAYGITFVIFFIIIIGLMFAILENYKPVENGEHQRFLQQAYTEGQIAAENQLPETCCPYGFNKTKSSITATEEYSSWMRGWTDKMIEIRTKNELLDNH